MSWSRVNLRDVEDQAAKHGMEAGPDGLEVLAFGPLGDGDAEIVEGLWEDPGG